MGLKKGKAEIARNALAKDLPFELICDITGLDMETIAGRPASWRVSKQSPSSPKTQGNSIYPVMMKSRSIN